MTPEMTNVDPDNVIETLGELREFLHTEHGVTVDPDDPIMMQFTMHRVFLSDYGRMLDRHNKAITSIISAAVKGLTEEALSENLKEQVRLTDRTHQEFERQYKRAKLLSVLNIISSAICLLVFSYLLLK